MSETTADPVGGRDFGPCSDPAPDSWASDPEDRDICTTCFHSCAEHSKEQP